VRWEVLTRPDWNIPKHLARFEIIENPDGLTSFKVFPYDENEGAVLFQCKFKPWSYFPYFTLSTRISKYFGVDVGCVQPPLPAGKGASVEIGGPDDESAPAVPGAEIVGTQRWCKITPNIYSGRTCLGWFDLQQPGGLTFLPGVKRWMVGAKLEDALLTFDDGELWDTPIPDNSKKTK
jgi:hypothetical protein